mgnify:CR=1 FL=1
MVAGQRLIASDNKEICLFPLEYMNISQGENGQYSHQGTLNIDFVGWGANGRILQCPYYAPVSCTCVAGGGVDNWRVFTSNDLVHLADGSLSKITWVQMHDNNPPSVGDTFTQGDLIGHTGTAGNVTGDHVHFNFALGNYAGWETVSSGQTQLKNSMHMYNACYINNTIIINDENYPWKTYAGPTPPIPTNKKRNFPWFIIARKRKDLTKI